MSGRPCATTEEAFPVQVSRPQHLIYHSDKLAGRLGRLDPTKLLIFNPASGHGRRIQGGPLVNLVKLQALLGSGAVLECEV
jgi:hypothetical protein